MQFEYEVVGGDFTNAGSTSSSVKKTLKQLNVDPVIIKRTVVALYEAEVNIVAHAYKGKIYINIEEDAISIRLEDEGPGIPDIDKAMEAGFSTASISVREMGFGAGMGLPNMKNNSDKLIVTSEVGKGTTIEIYNKLQ
ncbi:MAG: ATP-binding protein [Bacteroidales bacterium]|jgi:anti-sigma regulatory factor (Ser/Thr protein kinase)|nr:ATP-binding protein [Bacteroidales bacterium]